MSIIIYGLLIIGAYLLGSIPFGLLYSKVHGVDIRSIGSGNIGATNVSRRFGFWGGFIPVFLMDGLKGVIPVLIVRYIPVQGINPDIAMLGAGVAALLGHIFSLYLGFKGGKGVATGAGLLLAWAPIPVLMAIGVFLIVFLLFRIVAAASITAAFSLPFWVWFFAHGHPIVFVFSLVLFPLILFTHRKNLKEIFGKKI